MRDDQSRHGLDKGRSRSLSKLSRLMIQNQNEVIERMNENECK